MLRALRRPLASPASPVRAAVLLFAVASTLAPRAASAGEGRDFSAEVKALYRVVACTGEGPLPAGIDAGVVDAYCKKMTQHIATYRKNYVEGASRFIAEARPAGLPTTVVYPFGGGDLLSALTTYPDATDVTTLSLEHVGDPQRFLATTDKRKQATSLDLVRRMTGGLLLFNDSKTESLQKMMRGEIPGNLAFFLIGLATHGYEPLSLRYFRVDREGKLVYLEQADIDALQPNKAKLLHTSWVAPDFSEAFSNAEITFRRRGDASGAVRVHRHLAANLSDERLAQDDGVIRWLAAKGPVATMTKAASYLLWRDGFSKIRDYLLEHTRCMISDSTGIPVKWGSARGFTYVTYGRFKQSFLGASGEHNAAFRKLWESQPYRALPFRYGYIDGSEGKHFHMMVMTPGAKGAAVEAPRRSYAVAPRPDGLPIGSAAAAPGAPKPWLPREPARPVGAEPILDVEDDLGGGPHARVLTSFGVAHLWRPVGYDARHAGVVFYLHGYWANVDQVMGAHRLGDQFRVSRKNALFVVPEASAEDVDPVFATDPQRLLEEVTRASSLPIPDGPWVVIAHSGGFRTAAAWLELAPRVREIHLLDGLYNALPAFGAWASGGTAEAPRRLVAYGIETADRGDRLARRTPGGVRRVGLPETPYAFTDAEKAAPVLAVRTIIEHMAMVTDGELIPFVLATTPLVDVS
jgi:hypothetical protein